MDGLNVLRLRLFLVPKNLHKSNLAMVVFYSGLQMVWDEEQNKYLARESHLFGETSTLLTFFWAYPPPQGNEALWHLGLRVHFRG